MYLGIDIGATNIKTGIIDDDYELVCNSSYQTPNTGIVEQLLDFLADYINNQIIEYPSIKTIGIGVPGLVSSDGLVYIAPNLKNWHNIALKDTLEQRTGKTIAVDNDANAAAIAEMIHGAGKDANNFIYVTLGTGVGGTIIIERRLFRGEKGSAGEFGHIIIDSNARLNSEKSFRTGVLEEYIGKNQFTHLGTIILKKHKDSELHNYAKPDPYFVSQAASNGDKAAIEILQLVGHYLGIGLSTIVNILDISLIVVGGGISLAHPILLDTACQTVKKRALPSIAERVKIKQAFYTKDAGTIGAALLGKYCFEQNIQKGFCNGNY
jgi:glucokinase